MQKYTYRWNFRSQSNRKEHLELEGSQLFTRRNQNSNASFTPKYHNIQRNIREWEVYLYRDGIHQRRHSFEIHRRGIIACFRWLTCANNTSNFAGLELHAFLRNSSPRSQTWQHLDREKQAKQNPKNKDHWFWSI